jgi:hypothetical protein
MPISTGLPRQSLIFWRLLFSVMILREILLLSVSELPVADFNVSGPEWLSTSPL